MYCSVLQCTAVLTLTVCIQRSVQGGREAGGRSDRRGSFPASEGGQYPEEPLGLQGAEGRTGGHAGSGEL